MQTRKASISPGFDDPVSIFEYHPDLILNAQFVDPLDFELVIINSTSSGSHLESVPWDVMSIQPLKGVYPN